MNREILSFNFTTQKRESTTAQSPKTLVDGKYKVHEIIHNILES